MGMIFIYWLENIPGIKCMILLSESALRWKLYSVVIGRDRGPKPKGRTECNHRINKYHIPNWVSYTSKNLKVFKRSNIVSDNSASADERYVNGF